MSFISHDPGGRYRRRAEEGRRRFILYASVIGVLCSIAYWRGAESVLSSESAYQQQAMKLQGERAGLEQTITSLRSEVQSTQVRYQQLEAKYAQEVPTGALKQLTDLVKKQLDSGIEAERLTSAINAARPPKNCSEPAVKRFVIKTPVYSGPHGSVSFANGTITVTGQGESAVSPAGSPEAWYDPGKPVSISFILTGGKETVKNGLLPIHHSLVIANKEYRFTVAAGEHSFITVTSDSCDYP
jgi:cell division protein FtsB